MASRDSLTFDLAGCELREESENQRGWMNTAGVAHLLRYISSRPVWKFGLARKKPFCIG
jgi:hypothetical protein